MTIDKDRIDWFLTIAYDAIKHPSLVFQTINGYYVRTFFRMIRENGLKIATITVARTIYDQIGDESKENDALNTTNNECPSEVPLSDRPLVSIIIPVYNQYNYTIACINSVVKATNGIDIEIIVSDDNSSDETKEIDKIKNLIVIHNDKNLGFLKNCNNASKLARGKYIVFLNNDTLVGTDWLSSLIELTESDESIGLVGSKLIYPDGILQEAGGIICSDGSAWNYGKGHNPNISEYNYVKDADYVCGASIMVRSDLFRKIGGFDERYAPAYCEDSDLAFTIRKAGYRTVYQPKSEVIHFEGVSNGKTIKSKIKSYQIINIEKFKTKWDEELTKNHKPRGVDLFHTRDRSTGKITVLFIDSTIPKFDDNAGNRTVYDYMRTLVRMGYNVKLMTEDFRYNSKYTPIYESMGIEVLYGSEYSSKWKTWIKDNANNIDYIMLFRPNCAKFFLKFLKKNCTATVYYNVADLHFLRKEREYNITGNKKTLIESKRYKKLETQYLRRADLCVTVSTAEYEIISTLVNSTKIRVFPIFCYDTVKKFVKKYNSNNLIFVGSFNHPPNDDAIRWFIDSILPEILAVINNVTVNIVGSNISDDLRTKFSKCIIYHDHVSDDELTELYNEASVSIIPLRYGAGVKGKTIESIHNLVPIVSTSIGLEGIEDINLIAKPYDDVKSFTNEVIKLLSDNEYSNEISTKYYEYMKSHFSQEQMVNVFLKEFK